MIVLFIIYVVAGCLLIRHRKSQAPPPKEKKQEKEQKQQEKERQQLDRLYERLYINETMLNYYISHQLQDSAQYARATAENWNINERIKEIEGT